MWCTECGQPCDVIEVDFGIGPYEYWGQRCVQVDIQQVSNCCEATVTIEEPDPTPYCHGCGAMTKEGCDCGPIAENE